VTRFEAQARFYAERFRAPGVATSRQLRQRENQLERTTPGSDVRAEVTKEVETAAARMEGRSEVVILATSIVLSAAVVLLSTDKGLRSLELVAAGCSLASLYLSLFANLVYAGRRTLGLGPENADVDELSRRLAIKAALNAHSVALLYPASLALVIGALVT
jgi:hypothetical protein